MRINHFKFLSIHCLQIWLVIFPEGTRYNVNNKKVIEESQNFAAEQGKAFIKNYLHALNIF